jgi:hypothetical protein
MKVVLDRLSEDAEDLPIEEVEGVDEKQQRQDAGLNTTYRCAAPRPVGQNLYPTVKNSWRGLP